MPLTPSGFWQSLELHRAMGLVLKDSGGIAALSSDGDGKLVCQDELSIKPEFCFPGLGRKPDISPKCLTNRLELRLEAALALGQLQLLGKVSKISKVVFNEVSSPGGQLRESHGGGDASWDGIRELLGAPAGLDEVQEPEASPLTKLLVWADNQDSTSAVETSFCRKNGKCNI